MLQTIAAGVSNPEEKRDKELLPFAVVQTLKSDPLASCVDILELGT